MSDIVIYVEKNVSTNDSCFILNELLPKSSKVVQFSLPLTQVEKIFEGLPSIVILNADNRLFEDCVWFVSFIKPTIIFLLGDESGENSIFLKLLRHTQHIFLQYHHIHYQKSQQVSYIPLGYSGNMLSNIGTDCINLSHSYKTMKDRWYYWAFIGALRKEGEKMIETFQEMKPHIYGRSDHQSMAYIYMNSVFVINRRGHKSINCCRLYEASMCGAIPVVICSVEEFDSTFCFEERPPWLHAQSYKEAFDVMTELLKNMDGLQMLQNILFEWWQRRVRNTVTRIEHFLFTSKTESIQTEQTKTTGETDFKPIPMDRDFLVTSHQIQ